MHETERTSIFIHIFSLKYAYKNGITQDLKERTRLEHRPKDQFTERSPDDIEPQISSTPVSRPRGRFQDSPRGGRRTRVPPKRQPCFAHPTSVVLNGLSAHPRIANGGLTWDNVPIPRPWARRSRDLHRRSSLSVLCIVRQGCRGERKGKCLSNQDGETRSR